MGPEHQGTIHLGCETMEQLHHSYLDATENRCSKLPLIEMTIPSSIDTTISPPGQHVINLFCQYTPYSVEGGWTSANKRAFCDDVFDLIERYCPGFKHSVIGEPDILTPVDLEEEFGLTGGSIMHGAMGLERIFFNRPFAEIADYRTPIRGLYMCGAGMHPGGGVMGAAGRNCARVINGGEF